MKPARCLRLARQSNLSTYLASGNTSRPCVCRATITQSAEPARLVRRSYGTSAVKWSEKQRSRFADHVEQPVQSEETSPFKKQRLADIKKDQERELPLYPESYPRIQSSPQRKSVAEFNDDVEEDNTNLNNGPEQKPSEEMVIMGRVRAKRVLGKSLMFLDIVNEFQKVQILVNQKKCLAEDADGPDRFTLFRSLIQVGDHVSATGVESQTPAGARVLEATRLPELLSPTMEQIPEKLTDAKARRENRHLDMLVNPEVLDVLRLRSAIVKHMRDHFHSKRFLEFQTPVLAENAGGAIARPFVTEASEFRGKDLALRVAPELWLKRLVVGGVDKVFEIGPAFRNEGIDATHNPEFTMCEFYSAYSNLEDLIQETEELLYSLATHSQEMISTQLKSLQPIDLSRFVRPFKQVEFLPALEEAIGIRFPKLSAPGALPELLAILRLNGTEIPGEVPSTLPKLLDRLAALYLEPLSFTEPVFITNHPACMAPLAKSFLCPQTLQLVSARAELFVGGRELANMYEEENNPKEQERKMLAHRRLVNKPTGDIGISNERFEAEEEPDLGEDENTPLDQTFIKTLDYGLPPTGGWGCGVERLVMLFSGANRISDCLSFGTLRNVVGLSAEEEQRAKDIIEEEDAEGKRR